MKEAIIINSSNLTTPDRYKYEKVPVKSRRYLVLFGNFRIPLWNTTIGHKPVITLDELKIRIDLTDDRWKRIRICAERDYPVFLYQDDLGILHPAPLHKIDGRNTAIMLSNDRWLQFKKMVRDLHWMTMSKWVKIGRIAVPIVLSIMCGLIIIVGFVLFGKFGNDHTTILRSAVNATMQNNTGFIGRATGFISG